MKPQWLVMVAGGCRWALPREAVRKVERSGLRFRVRLRDLLLEVDELAGTASSLDVVPMGPLLEGLAPRGCLGFSIWRDSPLVIVDPDAPPPVLSSASADNTYEGAVDDV